MRAYKHHIVTFMKGSGSPPNVRDAYHIQFVVRVNKKMRFNKLFKSDSQRVAFSLCVAFSV